VVCNVKVGVDGAWSIQEKGVGIWVGLGRLEWLVVEWFWVRACALGSASILPACKKRPNSPFHALTRAVDEHQAPHDLGIICRHRGADEAADRVADDDGGGLGDAQDEVAEVVAPNV
jgi:hypothetical protein